jgi:hypothetical protein
MIDRREAMAVSRGPGDVDGEGCDAGFSRTRRGGFYPFHPFYPFGGLEPRAPRSGGVPMHTPSRLGTYPFAVVLERRRGTGRIWCNREITV